MDTPEDDWVSGVCKQVHLAKLVPVTFIVVARENSCSNLVSYGQRRPKLPTTVTEHAFCGHSRSSELFV